MSLEARIIIRDAIDGRVHLDKSLMFDGAREDYCALPQLLRNLNDEVFDYVMQVGAYALVKGHAPGSPADRKAS